MLVALLHISLSAEEARQQLSVLALWLWVQRPNIFSLLTLLHDGLEQAPERLQATGLLGGKERRDSNACGNAAELTVCRRDAAAAFSPGSSAVGAEV